eukprot:scaffold5221_cov122-Isochrysis_galbana.AAC.4
MVAGDGPSTCEGRMGRTHLKGTGKQARSVPQKDVGNPGNVACCGASEGFRMARQLLPRSRVPSFGSHAPSQML